MPKNLSNRVTAALSFLLLNFLLVSCEKNIASRNKKIDTAPVANSLAPSTTTTTTTPPASTGLYSLNYNWDNRPNGSYGYTQAATDLGNTNYWNAYNTQTSNGTLKTTLQANAIGTTAGAISKTFVPSGSEYQLSFDMMFDQNFDFSWGGKVGFGFLMGKGYTGGVPGWDGDGGSFRLMWYKNTSTSPVILKPYVYYKDQPGTYGNDFGKTYPSNGASISKGTWYNIKMYVKSNTGSNTNGWVKMVINGTTILDQSIRWTTNDLQRTVNSIVMETFRGGGEPYWASSANGDIYFDNVSWTQLAI